MNEFDLSNTNFIESPGCLEWLSFVFPLPYSFICIIGYFEFPGCTVPKFFACIYSKNSLKFIKLYSWKYHNVLYVNMLFMS